jgi:hypothetical protein
MRQLKAAGSIIAQLKQILGRHRGRFRISSPDDRG